MNKNSDNMAAEANREQPPLSGVFSLLSGNASVDGASQRGWFIGHFLESTYGLRSTSGVEIKWGKYHAGEERTLWGVQATTLCILFKGSVQFIFPQEEHFLSHEGGYIIWSADVPHRWKILEETWVLTVRWPSLSQSYQERAVFAYDTLLNKTASAR